MMLAARGKPGVGKGEGQGSGLLGSSSDSVTKALSGVGKSPSYDPVIPECL